jgi:hypothetical protein
METVKASRGHLTVAGALIALWIIFLAAMAIFG